MKIQNTITKRMQLFLLSILAICSFSCKKFIEVAPPITNITESSAYQSDATAIGAVTGIYAKMSGAGVSSNGLSMISVYTAGLASDEFALWSGSTNTVYIDAYQNNLNADHSGVTGVWLDAYRYLLICNTAIEGLQQSSSLSSKVKNQLTGEVKFMRAFLYFYLVNSFGDVPLLTGTDYRVNSLAARSTKSDVYNQIVKDLTEAKAVLNDQYLDATLLKTSTERVRPTKWAAAALLARAYLYQEKWQEAEAQATEVIGNATLFGIAGNPANAFLKNGTEAIWQLQPVDANFNTDFARLFNIPSTGMSTSNPVALSADLVSSFEANDKRRYGGNWIDSISSGGTTVYFNKKYKALAAGSLGSMTEYTMVLRLAEQYLIRAEARAKQNNLPGSAADIDKIRNRAGLANTTAATQATMLAAVYKERRAEMFAEWGDRWFDLKRTGNINAVMTIAAPKKGGTWNPIQQLFPIPQYELNKNPNLVQNPGY